MPVCVRACVCVFVRGWKPYRASVCQKLEAAYQADEDEIEIDGTYTVNLVRLSQASDFVHQRPSVDCRPSNIHRLTITTGRNGAIPIG